MQKIVISNFGAIEYFETSIKKVNILIGPQASGKSTISKSIFLVESVKKELIEYIKNLSSQDDITHLISKLNKRLRSFFIGIFGTTKHMSKFTIYYEFNATTNIKFYLDSAGWVQVNYSDNLKAEIENLKIDLSKLLEFNNCLRTNPFDEEITFQRTFLFSAINNKINQIFDAKTNMDYIPAGRSLLTVFAEQIGEINTTWLDLVTKRYIEKIVSLKKIFTDDLEQILENFKQFDIQKIDFARTRLSIEIIEKILKGKYRVENGEERIYFNNSQKYVKINFASSGQQESVWILNFIYYLILYRANSFLVIEEPEAHLYPEAQKDIVQLIALFASIDNNKTIITTHSPYILSSLNNLIYAGKLDKIGKKIDFIDNALIVDVNDVNAFFIENGKAYSIMDDEIAQIKAEEIDKASKIINEEFDRLMDLEYKNV